MASTAPATEPYPPNMPLTPGDSENGDLNEDPTEGIQESSSENSQTARRKRSAAEMENNPNGRGAETLETIEAEVSPDFTILCPVQARDANSPGIDLYIERDAPILAPELAIEFGVTPGKKWHNMTTFKNAKFKDPFVLIYSKGQIVYVNRHSPVPSSPPADASEDERLRYDKENLWVGLISEFRAENQEKVYVRVFWLYWPEELPMGRQSYHGKGELVLSNHVDIIEAQTIACHAEISHWDENDDSNKTVLQERYWRQTLDLNKSAVDPKNALSKLRRFCICGGYDNPSLDMYQCKTVGCGMWNHEACLKKDMEERAWEKFKKGTLGHEIPDRREDRGFTQKVGETFGHLVKKGLGREEGPNEAQSNTTTIAKGNKKLKLTSGGKKPWTGKLEANIFKLQRPGQEDTHAATVTQLVPTATSKAVPQFEAKVWNMKMCCLKCQESLN
ncbi:uncharacterized protein Z518_08826 [Rhinocladiella mackenziei CBS 650.93]|uniref:Rhinocladiella mackenziei CBS 650.93 unplaced genomic scaffold supercont1.6, whole genome shotgun sequence n=1 Tax=Rhinocladiella mackenziei CBS 650.93 TaxID=1442369 RepID=A0A0D2GXI2_9EURO|nr:uncharacterized protein Z518_08826 [Rhinocladiella mackenziei CBS 650.93]KIX02883.1 hypothetical protein Z518_08826 [Rhinocladiella mackenziei CBS 650.93]